MLNIFIYSCWTFVLLLWSPSSSPLPIFKGIFFFFWFWVVGVLYIVHIWLLVRYMVCKNVLPYKICVFTILKFDVVPFVCFCFYSLCFWCHIQEIIANFSVMKFFPYFLLGVEVFFKSLINCKLIFVCGIRQGLNFIFYM